MSIRSQLAVLALAAVCLPLAAVVWTGLVMFGLHDDAKFMAVGAVSTVCALGGSLLLGRRILGPLDELRVVSKRLAGGDLSARASESGPRELHELGASFNEMASNLEHLFDARRELVAWASHDLRTPLASLRAMVEALEDDLAEPAEYLPAIRAQTELLSELVEDLFELARIDSGALALELREASLGELVTSCLESLQADARSRGVRLESQVDASDPRGQGRARQGAARPAEPAGERRPPLAAGGRGRGDRPEGFGPRGRRGRGRGRRPRPGRAATDVRAILA